MVSVMASLVERNYSTVICQFLCDSEPLTLKILHLASLKEVQKRGNEVEGGNHSEGQCMNRYAKKVPDYMA